MSDETEDPVIEFNRQLAEVAALAATFDSMSNAKYLAAVKKARIELPLGTNCSAWRDATALQFNERLLGILDELAHR